MYYTYKEIEGDLQQGDVLVINDDLKQILSKFHPYYSDHSDYTHLMVLTQSCDLTKRNGNCKSRYISLAAVRSFETTIERELARHRRTSVEVRGNICSIESRKWFEDFLRKLFNNNLPSYFYLAEDHKFEFNEPKVAFLSLSIPIKSKDHYEACINARRLQLSEIFQAKLGWLVGNLYSRVGTPDWIPTQGTEEDFKEIISSISDGACIWLNQKALTFLNNSLMQKRKERGRNYFFSEIELSNLISDYAEKEEKAYEIVISEFLSEAKRTLTEVSSERWDILKGRLLNSTKLLKAME